MEIKLTEVAATSCVALAIPSLTYFFTKKHERNVARHNLKLSQYQEFIDALSGVIKDEATEDGHRRFAKATNTLHLVASNDVIRALHAYRREIARSNTERSDSRHDELLSKLVWEIRRDLGDLPTKQPRDFSVMLWASGPPKTRE